MYTSLSPSPPLPQLEKEMTSYIKLTVAYYLHLKHLLVVVVCVHVYVHVQVYLYYRLLMEVRGQPLGIASLLPC